MKKFWITLATTGLLTGAAHASNFSDIDADGDGLITLEELEAFQQSFAVDADSDGDGAVTVDELTAYLESDSDSAATIVDRIFSRLDDNDDGIIDDSELPEPPMSSAEIFANLDADSDGALSEEEVADARGERRGNGRRNGRRNR